MEQLVAGEGSCDPVGQKPVDELEGQQKQDESLGVDEQLVAVDKDHFAQHNAGKTYNVQKDGILAIEVQILI